MKSVLTSKLLPSVLLFTRVTLYNIRKNVEATHTKKLENLSKEQGRPLFNLHHTAKLFELDIVPPKHVLDTLALGPKNPVLEKSDWKAMLVEIDLLLNHLQEQNVSNETISDINIAAINYRCSKQSIPRNLIMTKKYIEKHNLLAVPFDKGNGICLIKPQAYENELMDILKFKQFKRLENLVKMQKKLFKRRRENQYYFRGAE